MAPSRMRERMAGLSKVLHLCMGLTLSAIALDYAEGRVVLVRDHQDPPSCEEFFDGARAASLNIEGLEREVAAANDCIKQNNLPVACKHWRGLVAVLNKIVPPLGDTKDDVEELMREAKCQASAAPALR
jgi:hypothetical protein